MIGILINLFYRDCCTEQAKKPYLLHKMNSYVENLSFCPYEDILGIGTERGFVSLLVPGIILKNIFDLIKKKLD